VVLTYDGLPGLEPGPRVTLLQKPFGRADLAARLRDLLDR
jgi:hypothetical protein